MDSLKLAHQTPTPAEDTGFNKAKCISKAALVNKLNYINFSDRTILVNFKHEKYGTVISFRARPLPCAGERLECVWTVTPDPGTMQVHIFQNLLIDDGHKCLMVDPKMVIIDEQGISMLLPEICHEIAYRKMNRHPCQGIRVQISQHGVMYSGDLVDISPVSLCAQVSTCSRQSFEWLNIALPVNLQLYSDQALLYSGDCSVVRQNCDLSKGILVLTPINTSFQRFKPKRFRSSRHRLTPSPNMVFHHPLSGTVVNLKILDLSGSGFSVEQDEVDSLLFAGLLIPEIELQFSQRFSIKCQAQVVYRTSGTGESAGSVICGLTILNMDMNDQVSLLSLLQQTENKSTYIDTTVDMDALWNFFFDTGFIYPSKYAYFQANKDQIKRTYERLYNRNPSIARHFIYQRKGHILGHMAMVRFYENTWMIHHHAASKTESMKAGLEVLKQISHYVNELHHLSSAHLKFVYCYFRPENKFPNRIFGGFSHQLNDLNGCSLDTFAYFHYRKREPDDGDLPESWALAEIRPQDYSELNSFYSYTSGGLMLEAFDLHSVPAVQNGLSQEYQHVGLKKEKRIYSLLEAGKLKAVIISDITDIGFNMANLTNCTTAIILDETTPRTILESALARASGEYEHEEMPVLVYPAIYAGRHCLPVEKSYMLWVMNLQFLDQYFLFCDTFFRSVQKPQTTDGNGTDNRTCHP